MGRDTGGAAYCSLALFTLVQLLLIPLNPYAQDLRWPVACVVLDPIDAVADVGLHSPPIGLLVPFEQNDEDHLPTRVRPAHP